MSEATHVDRVFVDPLSAGSPRLMGRYPSADDPAIGSQEREGWATYVYISEPHTMADCPFKDGPAMGVTDEMIGRASRAVEATLLFLDCPGTRMPGTESVDCQMVARVALEAALGGGVMGMDR